MLNTVYMDPNYSEYHVEIFRGMAPRFCAAELITDANEQSFTLLPIPAGRSRAIVEYCKIEYWELYLSSIKRWGISWENLQEGMTIRRESSS